MLHVITSIAAKRSSHLLHVPRTGSNSRTSAHNQGNIILHGTKKSLPPLQYTCSCQPHRRQLRMSTQPQQQTGVTRSPPPQAIKYCTTGPKTAPGVPHPTGHEPTQHTHYIVIDKQITHVICMGLYHLHPRPPTLCKTRSRLVTY